jgi:myosin heavy subunit
MQITLSCMKNIGFSIVEIEQILDIIVAILNLGNIEFEEG